MRSGFFNSDITGWDDQTGLPIFDRAENAEFLAKFFSVISDNGVYAPKGYEFTVTQWGATGMSLKVLPGIAMINGIMAWEDAARTIIFQASESLDRIDRVVLRLNLATRNIDLFVKKGIAASNPVAPALTRPQENESGDIYELGLADVLIPKHSTSIQQHRVTDLRLNPEICGLIYPRAAKINTEAIFTQLQSAVNDHMQVVQNAIDGTTAGNLSRRITSEKVTITLNASDWKGSSTPFTYRVSMPGATSTSNQELVFTDNATADQIKALQGANIVGGSQGNGYFTLRAFGKKPTINIPVVVIKRGDK